MSETLTLSPIFFCILKFTESQHLHADPLAANTAHTLGLLLQIHISCYGAFPSRGKQTASFCFKERIIHGVLFQIIKQRELLSSKALHLFLQSPLSVSAIRDNVEGRRDDEVAVDPEDIITDDRKISREGFGSLFGGAGDIARN